MASEAILKVCGNCSSYEGRKRAELLGEGRAWCTYPSEPPPSTRSGLSRGSALHINSVIMSAEEALTSDLNTSENLSRSPGTDPLRAQDLATSGDGSPSSPLGAPQGSPDDALPMAYSQ